MKTMQAVHPDRMWNSRGLVIETSIYYASIFMMLLNYYLTIERFGAKVVFKFES